MVSEDDIDEEVALPDRRRVMNGGANDGQAQGSAATHQASPTANGCPLHRLITSEDDSIRDGVTTSQIGSPICRPSSRGSNPRCLGLS